MKKQKILVLGKSGQLGQEISLILNDFDKYEVCCPNETDADISVLQKLDKVVDEAKPDVIVNCAAITNVDGCEKNSSKAMLVNSLGTENCAKVALKTNAFLIHISTDYVYDGNTGSEKISHKTHLEHEKPLNNYGLTKLQGEECIQNLMHEAAPYNYLILRTSGLYGRFGKNNFLKRMEEFLADKCYSTGDNNPISIICDQWYCPTSALQLARQIKKYIDIYISDIDYIIDKLGNVLNANNLGFTSPYLFLSEYLIMRDKKELLKYMQQTSFEEYFAGKDTARRPLNARLENEAEKEFGKALNVMAPIEEALEEFANIEKNK